jgi:hypothetical protein
MDDFFKYGFRGRINGAAGLGFLIAVHSKIDCAVYAVLSVAVFQVLPDTHYREIGR